MAARRVHLLVPGVAFHKCLYSHRSILNTYHYSLQRHISSGSHSFDNLAANLPRSYAVQATKTAEELSTVFKISKEGFIVKNNETVNISAKDLLEFLVTRKNISLDQSSIQSISVELLALNITIKPDKRKLLNDAIDAFEKESGITSKETGKKKTTNEVSAFDNVLLSESAIISKKTGKKKNQNKVSAFEKVNLTESGITSKETGDSFDSFAASLPPSYASQATKAASELANVFKISQEGFLVKNNETLKIPAKDLLEFLLTKKKSSLDQASIQIIAVELSGLNIKLRPHINKMIIEAKEKYLAEYVNKEKLTKDKKITVDKTLEYTLPAAKTEESQSTVVRPNIEIETAYKKISNAEEKEVRPLNEANEANKSEVKKTVELKAEAPGYMPKSAQLKCEEIKAVSSAVVLEKTEAIHVNNPAGEPKTDANKTEQKELKSKAERNPINTATIVEKTEANSKDTLTEGKEVGPANEGNENEAKKIIELKAEVYGGLPKTDQLQSEEIKPVSSAVILEKTETANENNPSREPELIKSKTGFVKYKLVSTDGIMPESDQMRNIEKIMEKSISTALRVSEIKPEASTKINTSGTESKGHETENLDIVGVVRELIISETNQATEKIVSNVTLNSIIPEKTPSVGSGSVQAGDVKSIIKTIEHTNTQAVHEQLIANKYKTKNAEVNGEKPLKVESHNFIKKTDIPETVQTQVKAHGEATSNLTKVQMEESKVKEKEVIFEPNMKQETGAGRQVSDGTNQERKQINANMGDGSGKSDFRKTAAGIGLLSALGLALFYLSRSRTGVKTETEDNIEREELNETDNCVIIADTTNGEDNQINTELMVVENTSIDHVENIGELMVVENTSIDHVENISELMVVENTSLHCVENLSVETEVSDSLRTASTLSVYNCEENKDATNNICNEQQIHDFQELELDEAHDDGRVWL